MRGSNEALRKKHTEDIKNILSVGEGVDMEDIHEGDENKNIRLISKTT